MISSDKVWSKFCLARDNQQCRFRFPGCTIRATGVHHIYGRALKFLRYEPLNGLSACTHCHRIIEDSPAEVKIYKRVMGESEFEKLTELKCEYYKTGFEK